MAKNQTNKPQAPKAPKFVQVHYSELAGQTLAYAIAEILGTVDDNYITNDDGTITNVTEFAPQDNWEQCKPFFIDYAPSFTIHRIGGQRSYYAVLANSKVAQVVGAHGPDHAVALLRAIVLNGLETEDRGQIPVPEEFLASQVKALALEKADAQGQLSFDQPASGTPTPATPAGSPAKPQEQPQEAKAATVDPAPAGKAEDKPQSKPDAQAKPADKPTGKPLPQGKQAQAMKDHGKPQEAK